MFLLRVLVLPDAPSGPSQACICPGCPLLWLKDCAKEGRWELAFPFQFFFAFVTHLLDICPLTTCPPPAHLYLILWPLCTPSLSVSFSVHPTPRSPPSIPFHPRRLSISVLLQSFSSTDSPLSSKQLLFLRFPSGCTIFQFSCSTSIVALHFFSSLAPIIVPL